MPGAGTGTGITTAERPVPAPPVRAPSPWEAYRLRWKRRRLLWRAVRARHQLTPVADRTEAIRPGDILSVTTLRNEMQRLPFFLRHYRRLGIGHFLVVDNGSDDGSGLFLADQPDVSLWRTSASYRASRFGLDWLTWLQMRHAHGHWCLMADADEILVYAHHDTHGLPDLTAWLDRTGRRAFGALMLDLYPRGPLGAQSHDPAADPAETLGWFDAGPYRSLRQPPLGNLWVQGGVRERVFFADAPRRSPTLNKLPLVRWSRRHAYVNSAHSILPPRLNMAYDGPGGTAPSGVLLHSKFLPDVVSRAGTEKRRGQHFHTPAQFDAYWDALVSRPVLWHPGAQRLKDWRQLEALGLLNAGGWTPDD